MKMQTETDPKAVLLAKLNGLHENYRVVGSDILLAIYERPEKTAGGIIIPEESTTRKEDRYQGKVGLILQIGPLVESKDLDNWFSGAFPKVGDWVTFRVGDTYSFEMNKVLCRLIEAKQLRGFVSEPDLIW